MKKTNSNFKNRLNIAYIRSRDDINKVLLLRNILEIEFNKTIPINLVLRGSIVRVGMFTEPEIYLQVLFHIISKKIRKENIFI